MSIDIKWTLDKVNTVRQFYKTDSPEQLAKRIGCTASALQTKLHELGIRMVLDKVLKPGRQPVAKAPKKKKLKPNPGAKAKPLKKPKPKPAPKPKSKPLSKAKPENHNTRHHKTVDPLIGRVPVRLSARTVVYMPAGYTQAQLNRAKLLMHIV